MRHIVILILLALAPFARAQYTWQAQVADIVSETGGPATGYLWLAPGNDSITALIFAFQNMNEETLFRSEKFRSAMADRNIGILWVAPGFGQEWDVMQGVQEPFDKLLVDLAAASRHPELTNVPLIPFGHSAQATMPWNFAAWNPGRTLCAISFHGDAPRTNLCGYGRSNIEWGRNRNIDGIPGLMIMGEYEWWDARLRPALAFRMMYPQSCISFLGDTGRGHFDLGDATIDYIIKFIDKSLHYRLKDNVLVKLDPAEGWLAATWEPGQTHRPEAAKANEYSGCRHEAFWYFDKEMADMTEARYARKGGQKQRYINYLSEQGNLCVYKPEAHCKISASITPDKDGCFEIEALFTDSTRTRTVPIDPSAIKVNYVSGPATQLGPGKFKVDHSHPTWQNPKRRAKVTLAAEAPADSIYKECVQEIEITLNIAQ